MIAIDTNILIYAHRTDSSNHEAASRALAELWNSDQPWAIAWPCLHEFLAVVTGPAYGTKVTPLPIALGNIESWASHARCRIIGETAAHLQTLANLTLPAGTRGGAIHDARIAAICIGNGVTELWSADRDFRMFPDLHTHNPLIASLHGPLPRYQAKLAPVRRAPSRRA